MASPLVRVLAPLVVPGADDEVRALVDRFVVSALRLLSDAGAEIGVVDVSAARRPPVTSLRGADGIVLLGGGDIDPALSGGDPETAGLYGVDRRVDDYSVDAVRVARDDDVPVLGICRGNQVINVAAGGTLYPDIADPRLHHGVSPDPLFVDESVTLSTGSWLANLYGTDRLVVRSGHHQAIRDVGSGLHACAWADDGIVEGVQADDGWCVGVQWHPEDADGSADDAAALFTGFVAACQR